MPKYELIADRHSAIQNGKRVTIYRGAIVDGPIPKGFMDRFREVPDSNSETVTQDAPQVKTPPPPPDASAAVADDKSKGGGKKGG